MYIYKRHQLTNNHDGNVLVPSIKPSVLPRRNDNGFIPSIIENNPHKNLPEVGNYYDLLAS